MMNARFNPSMLLKGVALSLLLGSTQTLAASDCNQPETPSLPDGSEASMDDMLAGKQSFIDFQQANIAYRDCLDDAMSAMKEDIKSGKKKAEDLQDDYGQLTEAFNAAIAEEEKLAAGFNEELRAFKQANP